MTPWRRKGRALYEIWVEPVDAPRKVCTTGTSDEATARLIAEWCDSLRERGDLQRVLSAIAAREIDLLKAYQFGEDGAARWVAARRSEKAQQASAVDVWPILEEWLRGRARGVKPLKTAQQQLTMLHHFWPESPCWSSLWTSDVIEERLAQLQGRTWKGKARAISDATRNRYRNVLSTAAEYLRRRKVLLTNVVEDVPSYGENALTFKYLELEDARALIDALHGEGRLAAALALGFGMEWAALEVVESRDINVSTWEAHAHGSKQHWRDRVVPLSDVFDWLKPIILDALRDKLPRTRLVTEPEWRLLRLQKEAAEAVRVQPITLHQWRHSCAVILLQAGETASNVAHILGHKDPTLVHRRYGRFMVRAHHMVTRGGRDRVATNLATSLLKTAPSGGQ